MVFVFGIDLPVVEVLLMLTLVTFILLVEITVMLFVLLYQTRRSKETTLLMSDMAKTLAAISKKGSGKKK